MEQTHTSIWVIPMALQLPTTKLIFIANLYSPFFRCSQIITLWCKIRSSLLQRDKNNYNITIISTWHYIFHIHTTRVSIFNSTCTCTCTCMYLSLSPWLLHLIETVQQQPAKMILYLTVWNSATTPYENPTGGTCMQCGMPLQGINLIHALTRIQ